MTEAVFAGSMPSIYDRVEKKYKDMKYVEEALELYAT